MKEYPCPLSPTKMCKYGGNKVYNYGFVSGTASYCRKDKVFVNRLKECPLLKTTLTERGEEDGKIKNLSYTTKI